MLWLFLHVWILINVKWCDVMCEYYFSFDDNLLQVLWNRFTFYFIEICVSVVAELKSYLGSICVHGASECKNDFISKFYVQVVP